MKKLVLISPKGPLYRYRSGIFKRSLRYAPLTLVTLVSLIPPELNYHVEIMDEGIQEIDLDIEADLIGMTLITGSAPRTYELADHFRRRGIPVVLGGPHVTLMPAEAEQHADSILTGYAEETWPQLLHDFEKGQMQAHYDQHPDLQLNNLPFPRRDLLPRFSYSTTHVFEATRACIHDCEFCVVPSAWGTKPYQKPVEDVIADIRQMRSKRVVFLDLNIIADRSYAIELTTALIPLKISWFGLSTILLAFDDELLQLFTKSGCRGLLVGFESISAKNLDSIKKGFNQPDKYAQALEQFHQHGISINGTFVFGMDEDTLSVFEETARFAVEYKIDLPRYAILTPFPNTALYKRLEKEERILTRDWSLYDGQHVVFQPRHMSQAELLAGTEYAWKYTYSLSNIARRIGLEFRNPLVCMAANFGYRFYAHNLKTHYTCDVRL